MKIGIIVYSNSPETVWNAFRFGNFALSMGDEVRAFLIGKGVGSQSLDMDMFKVSEQIQTFLDDGGKIFICGTCLEIHQLKAPETFTVATLKELYDIVSESDKVVTF